MKAIIIYTFMLFPLFNGNDFLQVSKLNRRHKMIDFLVKHENLMSSEDNFQKYNDAVYDRLILNKTKRTIRLAIYVFGTLSPHSGRYIALESTNDIKLLDSKNLINDMPIILTFLNSADIDKQSLVKMLMKITELYRYNNGLDFRLKIDAK